MIKKYLQNIFNTTKAGNVREESYYPDLKTLLEDWSEKSNRKYFITSLPKKTEGGNPDFRILTAKRELVGYIEAKAPTVENLENVESSEQLKRYTSTFPNVILTNFFNFKLYRHGKLIDEVQIGRPFIIHQLKTIPPVENEQKFLEFLDKFFDFSTPRTTTAKTLAIELAKRTRFLRDNVISEELKEENIKGVQTLEAFYKAFKEHLIQSLTLQEFSNLFAQTITYGLFAARSRSENGFNRKLAYELIPRTIGILRNVFRFISSTELPETMEWIIDDIAEVLSQADVKQIMENFYKEGKGHDPIIHFYETFLAEYDPKEREKRGVYYTPEPVVNFIVRSIHKLLKEKFNKEDGFATQSVTVLDPAAGTLTFPVEAIRLAVQEFKDKYGDGGVNSLIKQHILKNFYAFELMMAPYAIGHLKIGLILNELGYKLSEEERFNLFLTNTLDFTKEDPNQFPGIFEQTISKESQEALKVKEDIPVMVVMGNPPYSVSSTNIIKEGTEYYKLYESYKEKVRKEERNIQPLSDDYIKFIAFAHWKVKQAGQGIIGMITNNSYLDGLIHRDMRSKLLEDFDEIYILNLHGNSNKQEKTPKGDKDENVFDIQQGVSILILLKNSESKKTVKYLDFWGLREDKYKSLENRVISDKDWKDILPKEPYYFLVDKDFSYEDLYRKFYSCGEIFIKYNAGIATGKDEVFVNDNKENLLKKIQTTDKSAFILLMQSYGVNNSLIEKWYKELYRKEINNKVLPYSYRPFEEKFIYYDPKVIQRARDVIMKNMLGDNIALLTMRQYMYSTPYSHAFVTKNLVDRRIFISNRGAAHVFPLYLLHDKDIQATIFDGQQLLDVEGVQHTLRYTDNKEPNISHKFFDVFKRNYQKEPIPEEIFYYIYAILYSNIFRQKYQEFLKIDFPRIPLTKDYELFKILAGLGEHLAKLHLLESPDLSNPIVKFFGNGDNLVKKREYFKVTKPKVQNGPSIPITFQKTGIVLINENQYFGGIDPEIWNYYIGGYQVLDKWLKDRTDRILSPEDIRHYCKIITALSKTIEIQKEIDNLYPEVEKSLIEREKV